MSTRKTRWMSGLVAACMLMSMLAAFILPAGADTPVYYDEVVSATGLKDVSGLPEITSYTGAVNTYKVSSRAGMDFLADLVNGGNSLSGITIYQAADIDMGWAPFDGVGTGSTCVFKGTFDGNGFVIENLYVCMTSSEGVGLFSTSGATLKNIGIAGGLVIGHRRVGGISGAADNTVFINCWNAATVVGGGTDGVGGIAGTSRGSAKMYNCYNLGLIFNYARHASGLTGWINNVNAAIEFRMANSYNFGQIVTGFYAEALAEGTMELSGYSALLRMNAEKYTYTEGDATLEVPAINVGANNYYVTDAGTMGGYTAGTAAYQNAYGGNRLTGDDDSTGMEKAAFADGTVVNALNEGDFSAGAVEGYTVAYSQSSAGYPVLTYFKDGVVAVKRTAHTETNVGSNNWAEQSALFSKLSENIWGGFLAPDSTRLAEIKIGTANDLFVLGLVTAWNTASTNFLISSIQFTADIDMKDFTMMPVDHFVPIGATGTLNNVTVDGQYHVVKNWKGYGTLVTSNAAAGLISGLSQNSLVKNLGVIESATTYKRVTANPSSGAVYAYPALLLERAYDATSVENCFASGEIYILNSGAYDRNNLSGVVSRTWGGTGFYSRNCWADVTVNCLYNESVSKARTIGSSSAAQNESHIVNNYYVAASQVSGVDENVWLLQEAVDVDRASGELAYFLNGKLEQQWKMDGGNVVFSNAEEATHKITITRQSASGSVIGTSALYANAGSTVAIPEIDGYAVDEGSLPSGTAEGVFKMPAADLNLIYIGEGADLSVVYEIRDTYAQYDADLFVEDIGLISELANTIIDQFGNQDLTDPQIVAQVEPLINSLIQLKNTTPMELKNIWPYFPRYAEKAIYSAFNSENNWGISAKEDWLAATSEGAQIFSGVTFHLLNDVDMENTEMTPLGYREKFAGTVDGHGFAFQNIRINLVSETYGIGLISYLGTTGKLLNLGIESGAIDVVYNTNDSEGVGGLAGSAVGGALIRNCWNGASVKAVSGATGFTNFSIGGIVGRGYNNSIIDGCYNIGTVTGASHAAGINDWGQNNPGAALYNSFNAGRLMGGETQLARYNTLNFATLPIANTYAIGTRFYNQTSGDLNTLNTENVLSGDAYSNGELAYRLNTGYESGKGERTYYTVVDGKTVFGTVTNQVRMLTLRIDGSDTPQLIYLPAGTVYTLNVASNAVYELAAGSAGELKDGVLTMPAADVTVNVTFSGLNYVNLEAALQKCSSANPAYFADPAAFSAKVSEVQGKLEKNSYTTQAEVDADIEALGALWVYNGVAPALPRVTEISQYADAPGYMIDTAADMEYVAENIALYAAEKTLYLGADIDLTDSSFTHFEKMTASFDGCGYTISNQAESKGGYGLFRNYQGASIRNLTLDHYHAIGGYGRAILVSEASNAAELLIENVTIKNSSVKAPSGGNCMGGFISKSNGPNVTIRNCRITDSVLDGDVQKPGNVGLIAGQIAGKTFTVENVIAEGCTMQNLGAFGIGRAFGCIESAGIGNFKNIGVFNTTLTNTELGWETKGALIGIVKGEGLLKADNIMLAGNAGAEWAFNIKTDASAETKYTNFFSDMEMIHQEGAREGDNLLSAGAFASGEAAYLANSREVEQKWAMLSGESVPSLAAAETALPVRVTFTAMDESDSENNFTVYYYTDDTGVLIGIDDAFIASAPWAFEGDLKTAVFTEDTVVTANITSCTHEWGAWTHVEGTETHKRVCALCTKEEVANCTYGEEGWAHDDASDPSSHSKTCTACGNVAAEACSFTENVVAPTHTEGGYTEHTCETCGYSYQDNEQDALGHTWGEWTHVEGTENADAQHKHVCTADDGGEETLNCSFSERVVAPTCTVRGYTEHTCADCGYFYRDQYQEAPGHHYEDGVCVDCGAREDAVLGDVNSDGRVSIADAVMLLRHFAGYEVNIDLAVADINCDGSKDLGDVTYLMQMLNGWYPAS